MPQARRSELRASPRKAVSLTASLRQRGRPRTAVRVLDISHHGCRIEIAQGLSEDEWVWLAISNLETQYCRVAWARGEFAGLEFAAPLHSAVLERLIGNEDDFSEAECSRLAQLANRCQILAQAQPQGSEQVAHLARDTKRQLLVLEMRRRWG